MRNADAVPYSPEATEALIQSLAVHFGPGWKWSDIAEWTVSRASSSPPLPRWQIQWAKDFMENYYRTREEPQFSGAKTKTSSRARRSDRVPRGESGPRLVHSKKA